MPPVPESKNSARAWLAEIKRELKKEETWREQGKKIIEKFRNERGVDSGKPKANQYNILASNTLTLQAALYPKTPNPVARQRSSIDDKPAREAANILEKCLAFSLDEYDFDFTIRSALQDALLPGRANVRVKYIPTMVDVPQQVPVAAMENDKAAEDVQMDPATGEIQATVMQQEVGYEEVQCEYYNWKDIVYIGGDRWEKLKAVAFRGEYERDELIEQFGEKLGNEIRLTLKGDERDGGKADNDMPDRALVWEVWDRRKKARLYLSEGYPDILKEEPDPLKLKGFFPIPRPLAFINTNDMMIPVPLFELYRDQSDELNRITARIQRLIAKLQAKGLYNAVVKEIADLYQEEDNTYLPVTIPQDIDLNRMVIHWPIEQIAKVLQSLYLQRDQIKSVIYEITGISDIIRGASVASETATAQRIKGQYASIRLDDLRNEVKRFVRDLMDLKAEIIATHFMPETLLAISGVKLPTQAEKMQAQMELQNQVMIEQQMMAQQAAMQGAPDARPVAA